MGLSFLCSSQKQKQTSTQTCRLNLPPRHNKVCDFIHCLQRTEGKEIIVGHRKQDAAGVEISLVRLFQLSAHTHTHTQTHTHNNQKKKLSDY
jgi:hypothetical protein